MSLIRPMPVRRAPFHWLPVIALLAAAVVGQGTISPTFSPARAADESPEAAIVKKIELLGGRISGDETRPDRSVVSVDFSERRRISSTFLGLLKGLPQLQNVDFTNSNLTDAGLARLEILPASRRCRSTVARSAMKACVPSAS